jgi:hypothetical protein
LTVSTTTSRADYNGNGTTTAFAVPFYFLDQTHLTVLRTQISTGVITTLALTTDYTVTGAGNPAGGTVTALVAPTADQKLSILRNVPLTQLNTYVPNDPFPAASHEQALDKLTMEVQQLDEAIDRALTLPANTTAGTVSTSLPTPAANQVIAWNSTATGLQNLNAQSLASIVSSGNAYTDIFSGNGVQTVFNLSSNPGSVSNLVVSISGVVQRPNIDYTWVSGTTLTISPAPASGTNNILVQYTNALPQGVAVKDAQTFDTVATVTASAVDVSVNHIRTAGYYATGDGGGALYKRSTGTPTGVGTRYITSNSGTVVWELEPSNFINVRALGASPSASAADNTAAINAAMALGPAYIPPGTYNYTQVGATGVAFTLAAGYQLLATPREVTLVGASGTYETFRVTGSNTRVEGVDFNDAAKTAGAFHHIQCGTSGIEETRVTNMIVYRSTGGAIDSGATTAPYGTHTKTYWEDVVFLGHRGPGFTYTRSFAFLTIGRKCVVDYPQTPTGSENHTAFDYNGANMPAGAGGLILGLEVLGTSGNATTTTSQKGFFIRNTAAVFILNARVDAVEGEGIRLENCNGVYLQDAHVGLCDSHSLIFKDTGYVFGTVSINGRRIAGGGTNKDGIRYEGGCQYHNIKPWIVDIKGNGINCTTTTDTSIHFHDMHIITCEGTGILTSTGGFLNFSDGLINMPGAVADYNLGSTNHKIWNVLLTSGSPASVNTPIAYNARTTEAVRISSAGDVAIGSNNPVGARLQASAAGNLNAPVLGSIGTAPNRAPFYLSNLDQSYGLVVGNNSSDGHVWFQAQRVDSATTTYNITLNEAGGNVGIGMASPSHRLDVTGSARFNGNLGFYNATPVAQPNTTGTTTGFTAGTGTAVNDASTFTGGVGTRAYRISDIVKALKDLGLIASS